MQNKANLYRFSYKNSDYDKKQSQFKPNSKPILAKQTQFGGDSNPNKPNLVRRRRIKVKIGKKL